MFYESKVYENLCLAAQACIVGIHGEEPSSVAATMATISTMAIAVYKAEGSKTYEEILVEFGFVPEIANRLSNLHRKEEEKERANS